MRVKRAAARVRRMPPVLGVSRTYADARGKAAKRKSRDAVARRNHRGPLSDRGGAGVGRHGHRLYGAPSHAAAQRCAESAVLRTVARRRIPRPVHPRSRPGRHAQSPQRRHGVRPRPDRRGAAVDRDGVRRRHARRSAGRRQPHPGADRAGHHRRRESPRLRPFPAGAAPRHQAGQLPDRRARQRRQRTDAAGRLRHRPCAG